MGPIYLKRRQLALDYWRQIPAEKVYPRLAGYIRSDNSTMLGAHLSAVGLDSLECGTTACLAGWLITMPEVLGDYHSSHDESASKEENLDSRLSHLQIWLGLPSRNPLFSARLPDEAPGESDWACALHRLEACVEEARGEGTCSHAGEDRP